MIFPSTQRPVLSTQQPVVSTQQPVVSTQRPVVSTQRPVVSTQQPVLSTQQPVVPSTQQPVVTSTLLHIVTSSARPTAPPKYTPSPDHDAHDYCKGQTDGIHSFPGDCSSFLECSNGYTYLFHCAPGSVYNPAISNCDSPHNVPACQHSGGDLNVPPGVITADPPHTPSVTQDINNFCHGHADGIFADPTSCVHFIECSNGHTFRERCGPGTAWHQDISTCDLLANVPGCHS
ncbi:putative endochitinase [Babylonia areolata]|uniref:putative endochitinase n=1 Tax=Babylonia areolata TaxID=304850 RepID=UPI003FCFEECE